jgi:hypothetical protein
MARPKGSINKKEEVKKVIPIINTPRVIDTLRVKETVVTISNKVQNGFDPSLPESKQRWLR